MARRSDSPLNLDQQIHTHLGRAEKALQAAISVARTGRKVVGPYRARRTERDLGKALTAVTSIRSLGAPATAGESDPDLMPEDERANSWREARESARTARIAALQGDIKPRGEG